MKQVFLFLVTTTFFLASCNIGENQRKAAELENENLRLKQQLEEQKVQTEKTVSELQQTTLQLQEQVEEQSLQKELEQKAKNEPVSISGLTISNVTKQGTTLSTNSPYKKWDVRYIKWECNYEDYVVKAGGKSYGDLYVKYMHKNDGYENSWRVFNSQGSFNEINGNSNYYTRKYNMVDDGKEYGSWEGRLGSESGGDFEVGKWKIEIYWDKDHQNKAIYLGGAYFEIY